MRPLNAAGILGLQGAEDVKEAPGRPMKCPEDMWISKQETERASHSLPAL